MPKAFMLFLMLTLVPLFAGSRTPHASREIPTLSSAYRDHFGDEAILLPKDDSDPFPKTVLELDDLPERYQTIIKGVPVLQLLGTGVMGFIFALPSETSNWDKDTFKSHPLWWNWYHNIKKGPVFDNDSWFINYVDHPYVGSAYYVWGRDAGLSRKESAALSAFLSVVYWEYGWEAMVEPPSWQDLFVTPIIGSLIGEGAYYLKEKINANNGYLYGSKLLGGIAKMLLDPIGEINRKLARFLTKKNIRPQTRFELFYERARYRIDYREITTYQEPRYVGNRIGIRVRVKF